jgi:Zn-dependent M28 family amino/carboxypeptidase
MNEMELIESISNSTRAPGGNDDGSGVSALLAIAKAIERKSVKFGVNVELVAFAGEEQGLLGSRAYASQSTSHSALFEILKSLQPNFARNLRMSFL